MVIVDPIPPILFATPFPGFTFLTLATIAAGTRISPIVDNVDEPVLRLQRNLILLDECWHQPKYE